MPWHPGEGLACMRGQWACSAQVWVPRTRRTGLSSSRCLQVPCPQQYAFSHIKFMSVICDQCKLQYMHLRNSYDDIRDGGPGIDDPRRGLGVFQEAQHQFLVWLHMCGGECFLDANHSAASVAFPSQHMLPGACRYEDW